MIKEQEKITGHRAFTLIELLVVISIIVVLIAMLVPALEKAMSQAAYAKWVATMADMARDPDVVALYTFLETGAELENKAFGTNSAKGGPNASSQATALDQGKFLNGQLFGDVHWVREGRWGKPALNFPGGGSDFVQVKPGTGINQLGKECTVMAWFKVNDAANRTIIHKWGAGAAFTLEIHNGEAGFVLRFDDGAVIHIRTLSGVPINRWVHLVGVYDGQNIKVFQNGKLMNSIAVDPPGKGINEDGGYFTIGSRSEDWARQNQTYGKHWGLIDEVAVFRRAFTDEFVEEMYDLGAAGAR